MKTQYTPGPWRTGRKVARFVYASDETPICECDSMSESKRATEEANARLIAAAPELLAALIALDAECNARGMGGQDCMEQARAAISKASA